MVHLQDTMEDRCKLPEPLSCALSSVSPLFAPLTLVMNFILRGWNGYPSTISMFCISTCGKTPAGQLVFCRRMSSASSILSNLCSSYYPSTLASKSKATHHLEEAALVRRAIWSWKRADQVANIA